MKKLLSILAALGLTATASATVVACTTDSMIKNVKVDGNNVTFDVDNLIMDQDFATVELVNAHYAVFDSNQKYVATSKLVSTDNTTTFKSDHKYDFTVSFTIPDGNNDTKFYFGVMGKSNIMGKKLGTVKVNGNNNQNDVTNNFSGSVKVSFNKMPTQDEMKDLFALKDNEGNEIPNVKYSFEKIDSVFKVFADAEGQVNGILSYSFQLKPGVKTSKVEITPTDKAVAEGIVDKSWKAEGTVQQSVKYVPINIVLEPKSLGKIDAPNGLGKMDYYYNRDMLVDAMSDEQAALVYAQLFQEEVSPSDAKAKLHEQVKAEHMSYGPVFTGINITKDNYNTAFAGEDQGKEGDPAGYCAVKPDGKTYEMGLFNEEIDNKIINSRGNRQWYWISVSFTSKTIND